MRAERLENVKFKFMHLDDVLRLMPRHVDAAVLHSHLFETNLPSLTYDDAATDLQFEALGSPQSAKHL